VCERAILEAVEITETLREQAPRGKLSEESVHDALEKICKPKLREGRWLTALDFKSTKDVPDLNSPSGGGHIIGAWNPRFAAAVAPAKGEFLIIQEHPQPGGHCEEECMTAAASCVALLEEELDVDDLAVAAWRGETRNEALARTACLDWTNRCRKKRIPLSQPWKDYIYKSKDASSFQMDDLMASMDAAGLTGQVFDRDSMNALQDTAEKDATEMRETPPFMREEL